MLSVAALGWRLGGPLARVVDHAIDADALDGRRILD